MRRIGKAFPGIVELRGVDLEMGATFTYPFVAPEGIQYGYKVAKGEKLDKEIVLPTHQIDASNVDQWIGKGF